MAVEVFKTNVADLYNAKMLIGRIHEIFTDYKANFDLDDCDNILRVQCAAGSIQSAVLIGLLFQYGYSAEVLPDNCQPTARLEMNSRLSYQ